MKFKLLISFAFVAIFSMVQAQMPVKKMLNPFMSNSQELKVEKRSLETDLPEFEIRVRWDVDSDGWSDDDIDTTINGYSDNGWLTSRTQIYSWGSKSRDAYTYDGAGRELTRLTYRYMNGNWDTSSLWTHTYDEKGLMKQTAYKSGYYAHRWGDSSFNRYTNKVDQQGRIIERVEEGWTAIDGYEFEEKTVYSYGSDGKMNQFESYDWNDSLNAFDISVRYDSITWYQYIENDEELEKSKPLYAKGVMFYEGLQGKITVSFSYDMHDNVLEETTFFQDDQGNESKESGRYEYTYDSKGRCTQRIEFDYDEEEGVYTPRSKWIYAKFYTAPNLATQKLVTNEKVYPNPAVDYIFLKEKVTDLELLNMQGQHQLSIKFLEADVPFDISSLTAGTYILSYRNQEGLLRTSQLLIQ